jgi:hypothetical protein
MSGLLQPGNLGAFAEPCPNCGCRYPGALGHGPPCQCPGEQPDLLVELAKTLLLPPEVKVCDICGCQCDSCNCELEAPLKETVAALEKQIEKLKARLDRKHVTLKHKMDDLRIAQARYQEAEARLEQIRAMTQ